MVESPSLVKNAIRTKQIFSKVYSLKEGGKTIKFVYLLFYELFYTHTVSVGMCPTLKLKPLNKIHQGVQLNPSRVGCQYS